MISRRDFLRLAATAAATLAVPWKVQSLGVLAASQAFAAAKPRVFSGSKPGITFTKYADPLPVIQVMPAAGMMHRYRIALQQFTQKIHRDLPPTTLWGFGALGHPPSVPGATSEAQINRPVKVRWINDLPPTHLLAAAVDHAIHGAEKKFPEVRAVVHLHDGATAPESDGYPEDWYSPTGVRMDGRVGDNYADYTYHNGQFAGALRYHEHTLGITRLNIISGLAVCIFSGTATIPGDLLRQTPATPIRGKTAWACPGQLPATALDPFTRFPC